MENFLKIYPDIFGMHILDNSIKAVQLKRAKNGYFLQGFHKENFEKGIIEDGEIKNLEKLQEILKNFYIAKKKSGITAKNVICSVPESQTFIHTISIPSDLSEEELKEAIYWEAGVSIPISIEDAYIDWKKIPCSSGEKNQKIFLSAVPRNIVDNCENVLNSAGFRVAAMETEPDALARIISKKISGKDAELVINISDSKTIFAVIRENAARFASSIKNNDLSVVEEESKKAVDFAKEHVVKNGTLRISLMGAGVDLENFSNVLAEKINVEVSVENPWDKIEKNKKQLEMLKNLNAFVSLGLAMRAVDMYK